MKTFHIFSLLALTSLILSACGQSQPSLTSVPTIPPPSPSNTAIPTATEAPLPSGPTSFTTSGWSTTASSRTELSFAFPGEWDGSSALTFGEGEFVKDPNQPLGVTFQIDLSGSLDSLLNAWGTKDIGIVGIVTFAPESVTDGQNVTIARIETPTKIAQGNGITAQVAYIQRAGDVMEVMWFGPTEQWETLQPVFQGVLENIEIWRKYPNSANGLQAIYVHDWLEPQPTWEDTGLWFRSADERSGVAIFIKNEIADPIQLLQAWNTERLTPLGFSNCTLDKGDRMDTMGGQWESSTGNCTNANGEQVTYEIAFVPNKNRLLEIITYAPADMWEAANAVAFKHLLGLLTDIRP